MDILNDLISPIHFSEVEEGSIGLQYKLTIRVLESEFGTLSEHLRRAILIYFIMENRGHTAVPLDSNSDGYLKQVIGESAPALKWDRLNEGALSKEIESLSTNRLFPFQVDDGLFVLRRIQLMEQKIADTLISRGEASTLEHVQNRIKQFDNSEWVSSLFSDRDNNPGPYLSAKRLMQNGISILTGGPGTGKTTAAAQILLSWVRVQKESSTRHLSQETSKNSDRTYEIQSTFSIPARPVRIALTAPTGKAASRLLKQVSSRLNELGATPQELEWIPLESSTLHRILHPFMRNEVLPDPNRKQSLPYDLIVVDEASMLDLTLFHALIQHLHSDTDLLLIGDPNQLESVEEGAIFRDLCAVDLPKKLSPVQLTQNFRFEEKSGIGALAEAILTGTPSKVLQRGASDLEWVQEEIDQSLLDSLVDKLVSKQLELESFTTEELLQYWGQEIWLTPLRVTGIGSDQLNQSVQERVVRKGKIFAHKNWFHGKPFMVTKNHYRLGVFNGERGVCGRNNDGDLALFIESGEKIREIPLDVPLHTESSWFLTVHKSQGSEFNKVNLILHDQYPTVLSKQLVYTAITRAKDKFTLYGAASLLDQISGTHQIRFTTLQKSLNKRAFS